MNQQTPNLVGPPGARADVFVPNALRCRCHADTGRFLGPYTNGAMDSPRFDV